MESAKKLLFELRLKECYDRLPKAEKRVADYMTAHLDEIQGQSAYQIGALSETGAATVVRFCRRCGFLGLSELKSSLKREEIALARSSEINILPSDTTSIVKQKVLGYHEAIIDALKLQKNEEALEAAVDAILSAKKVVISGAGDSSAMAIILNNNLDMQGWETYYSSDQVQELAHMSRLEEGDIMIGFSYTGRFRYLVENFKIAKKKGVTTIGILGHPGSPCEPYCDIVLYTSAEQKEYFFGSQTSLIGDFALVELLTTMLAARRPVDREHTEAIWRMLEMHRLPSEDQTQ